MNDGSDPNAVVRIGHIDDHETVQLGLASLLANEAGLHLVVSASSVGEILPRLRELDLVVLDMRLADGSTVTDNVTTLVDLGMNVLAFTAADSAADLRAASRAGVLGIVRKSDSRAMIVDAIRLAARGEAIATTEWAAAIDSDPRLGSADLSPKEQEILAFYASGDKSVTVAHRANLSASTVAEYVRRIRYKYAMAGRPAYTKVDLYKRAVEDGILPSPNS